MAGRARAALTAGAPRTLLRRRLFASVLVGHVEQGALHVGHRQIGNVEGPFGKLHRRLFGTSPEAGPTGVSVKVLVGAYALAGDGDGDAPATVEAGTSVVLDPERLTAASGEWTLTRPAGNPHARYELVIGPAPTFTLQRHVPPDEPDGEAAWEDVDETLNLQTTARLRPKPVG